MNPSLLNPMFCFTNWFPGRILTNCQRIGHRTRMRSGQKCDRSLCHWVQMLFPLLSCCPPGSRQLSQTPLSPQRIPASCVTVLSCSFWCPRLLALVSEIPQRFSPALQHWPNHPTIKRDWIRHPVLWTGSVPSTPVHLLKPEALMRCAGSQITNHHLEVRLLGSDWALKVEPPEGMSALRRR